MVQLQAASVTGGLVVGDRRPSAARVPRAGKHRRTCDEVITMQHWNERTASAATAFCYQLSPSRSLS